MKLDVSDFKKLSENDHSAVLMHPHGGHKIVIAKKILSPKQKLDLKKMPMHLADGTPDATVPDNSDQTADASDGSQQALQEQAQADNQAQPAQAAQTPNIVINNTPAPAQPNNTAQTQTAQQQAAAQQQAQPNNTAQTQTAQQQAMPNPYSTQNDPYGANAYGEISKEGLQNLTQGAQGEASGQNEINQAMAGASGVGAGEEQNQLQQYQAHEAALRKEYQGFVNDVQGGMVDPNHYMNSRTTGQKIANSIGLLLGGIGSGLTGQPNAALEYMNKQIQNDIQAQTTNLGAKQNLVSANMQQFGNETQAAQMSEVMMRGVVANQIQQAALKTGNPLLIAKAQQAVGQIELQNNALLSNIAVRKTLGSQGAQAQPNSQNQSNSQLPAAQQVRMLSMSGLMPEADKTEAIKELQKKEEADNFLNLYQKGFNQVNNMTANGSFSPAARASVVNLLAGHLNKLTSGRFNMDESKQQIDSILPRSIWQGYESPETSAGKPANARALIYGMTPTPTLDQYGIKTQNHPIYNSQGQSNVKEGRAVLP